MPKNSLCGKIVSLKQYKILKTLVKVYEGIQRPGID
jgi:hypothetical protein